VRFVVDKGELWQDLYEYFGFPWQFSFHQLLYTHLSSGAGTIEQLVANVPSGLNLTQRTVMCIARQRTGKHLATEYTHAAIELRMLLLVARQQSTPMKSLTRNYVTGFLWVSAVIIAVQRLDKRTLNNKATVFRGAHAEGLS
jgi:hypothetical protein